MKSKAFKIKSMSVIKKLLVVDDDQVSLKLMKTLSEHLGWSLTCVSSGEEAVKVQKKASHDVVVSDIEMPGLDGFQLLELFRSKWPDTPFIVFTGYGSDEVMQKAWKLGAFDFLTKPIDVANLKETLRLAVSLEQPTVQKRQENPYMMDQEILPTLNDITNEMLKIIGKEAFVEIVESFKVQAKEDLDNMYRAVDDMDKGDLRHWAHKLAGAASNLGMFEVEKFAKKIEGEDISSWSIMQVYLNKLERFIFAALKEISKLIEHNVDDWEYSR